MYNIKERKREEKKRGEEYSSNTTEIKKRYTFEFLSLSFLVVNKGTHTHKHTHA